MPGNKLQQTDLVIVGAGPAGVSALLWAGQLGIGHCTLLDSAPHWGGQLHHIHQRVQDYMGLPETGPQIVTRLDRQLAPWRHRVQLQQRVVHIDATLGLLRTESGLQIQTRAILLAPGMAARTLVFPGKEHLLQQAARLSFFQNTDFFKGASVAVVGAGDGALENAFHLSRICPQVHLLVRSQVRARADLVQRLKQARNVCWHDRAVPTNLIGGDQLQAVEINHDREIKVEKLLINIGYAPNTGWLRQTVQLDAAGFIQVDPWQQTSQPAIWAAGDACAPRYPSLALAVGQASVALKRMRETVPFNSGTWPAGSHQ